MRWRSSLILLLMCFISLSSNAQYLDAQQQSIVSIASLTAKGDLENLKPALAKGLEAGLTVNEIKEILVHLYAYCGFPRSISGLQTFLSVLNERKANGITDNWGKEASPINQDGNKYERGKEVLEDLMQRKLGHTKPAYQQFSPEMDTFLKEHLFADIFERDVLSYPQRELITVSALITLGNVEPMLRGHMGISMVQGFSTEQLQETINLVRPNVKRKNIKLAQNILDNWVDKP